MKPGDHPDFFRFPAPEGQSRESTIILDENGTFWHDGERITRPKMVQAFFSWIRRHPDDGRFILENGYDWTYFEVRDVPFIVRTLSIPPEGGSAPSRAFVVLSDGSKEELDPATLTVGPQEVVYCRVKGGEFEARFSPEAQTALGPILIERADGFAVTLGGREFPVKRRA
jgi:hypothetical protein